METKRFCKIKLYLSFSTKTYYSDISPDAILLLYRKSML